jgi:hypothetical protein
MTTKPTPKTQPAGDSYGLTSLPDPPKPPDAMQQRPHIARMDQVLRAHFANRPDALVSGEGYLCDLPGNARRSPNPDLLVSFGLEIPPDVIEDEANGYTISEIGKPPEFVLEVASETTARRDETVKRDTYASFGISEYWRFDRTGGRYYVAALAGDRLVDGAYQPISVETGDDGIIRGYSAALDLELHWKDRRLRFWNRPAHAYLPDLLEALAALAAERSELAVERAARQTAEEEVARLRAELERQRDQR